MQFRNQSTADSSNATNSCRVVSENSTRPLHFSIPLTAAAVSTCVWICGALYLVLLRRHRAMRASGVELSACVLAAAALRLASLVLIAFSQRTRLWCAGLSSLAMLATTLTLTAIALKAFRIHRVSIAAIKGTQKVKCTSRSSVIIQFLCSALVQTFLVMILFIPLTTVELKQVSSPIIATLSTRLIPSDSAASDTLIQSINSTTAFSNDSLPPQISYSLCTRACAFSAVPLSALYYSVFVLVLAALAIYYTFRIRRFHKYFRQTRVLALLLMCSLSSSFLNFGLLFLRHGFHPFVRSLAWTISQSVLAVVAVLCTVGPVILATLTNDAAAQHGAQQIHLHVHYHHRHHHHRNHQNQHNDSGNGSGTLAAPPPTSSETSFSFPLRSYRRSNASDLADYNRYSPWR